MGHSLGWQVRRVLALLWSSLTIGFFLFISVLILSDPRFPLNLGSINTTGRAGLWATLPPGVVGLSGIVLMFCHSAWGARMLGIYSLFWAAMIASGLPAVWNAQRTFCTRTFCIQTPWISRLLVLGLATPFLLVALWSRRQASQESR